MEGEISKVNLHEIIQPTTDRLTIDFIKELRSSGLEPAIQHIMNANGIEPKYNDEDEESLAKQREKLKTMPGIIIANHPGRFDTLIVLDILKM